MPQDIIYLAEKLLEYCCHNQIERFPRPEEHYYEKYRTITAQLKQNVYPLIDSGLSCREPSESIYTFHGAQHFDAVIQTMGDLLGIQEDIDFSIFCKITPYELFILLLAIRFHDIGNIRGRENHEKKIKECLPQSIEKLLPRFERSLIIKIAAAHGGTHAKNGKDTISALEEVTGSGRSKVRVRSLAALVRIADELSENSDRTSSLISENRQIIPDENMIYHKYAESIMSLSYDCQERCISITYNIRFEDLSQKYGCHKNEDGEVLTSYLVDEIYKRLDKLNRERIYCNQFSIEILSIKSIKSSIIILNDDDDEVDRIVLPIIEDKGYPADNVFSLYQCMVTQSLTGKDLAIKYSNDSAEEI